MPIANASHDRVTQQNRFAWSGHICASAEQGRLMADGLRARWVVSGGSVDECVDGAADVDPRSVQTSGSIVGAESEHGSGFE